MTRLKNSDKEKRIDILAKYEDDDEIVSVYVEDYKKDYVRDGVINANKLVIPDEEISISFTYPLTNKALFLFKNKGGFTRLDLFRCIYEGYKKIYDEETQDAGDPGIYEMLYNRKKSNGRYGIWGHYMNDLRIEGIHYNPTKKQVVLSIGS